MGYTLDWADALEKRVGDGRKTAIYQPAFERAIHDVRTLRNVRYFAQDWLQVEGPACRFRDGRSGAPEPCSEVRDLPNRSGCREVDCCREAPPSDMGSEEDSTCVGDETWNGKSSGGEHCGRGSQAARDGEGTQKKGWELWKGTGNFQSVTFRPQQRRHHQLLQQFPHLRNEGLFFGSDDAGKFVEGVVVGQTNY